MSLVRLGPSMMKLHAASLSCSIARFFEAPVPLRRCAVCRPRWPPRPIRGFNGQARGLDFGAGAVCADCLHAKCPFTVRQSSQRTEEASMAFEMRFIGLMTQAKITDFKGVDRQIAVLYNVPEVAHYARISFDVHDYYPSPTSTVP